MFHISFSFIFGDSLTTGPHALRATFVHIRAPGKVLENNELHWQKRKFADFKKRKPS